MFYLKKVKRNKIDEDKLLVEMEVADKEVWKQRKYLQENAAGLREEEILEIENKIDRAEERYLLLELQRA